MVATDGGATLVVSHRVLRSGLWMQLDHLGSVVGSDQLDLGILSRRAEDPLPGPARVAPVAGASLSNAPGPSSPMVMHDCRQQGLTYQTGVQSKLAMLQGAPRVVWMTVRFWSLNCAWVPRVWLL